MKCNHCGKEGVHVCISAGFSALVLVDQLEDAERARLHLLPYAAAELRRLHDENEALKAAQYECGFGAGCCYQAAKSEADEVLLRQALEALELRCGTNADERKELIPALRERLGETK